VQIPKIQKFSVEVLSSLCSDLRNPAGWPFWPCLRRMRISPWRLHAIPRDYNSCVGNWMRFKHIYNMYRFAESIRLLFEKIVEKLLFYGGQNFTYCTPANLHMNSNFFLFLIFNLERLPDLEKSRTPHKSEHKCIQVDFYNVWLHVPSTHRMLMGFHGDCIIFDKTTIIV
jgi:hypothetical protein